MASYFYSPETSGFYIEGVHREMPKDVFEVTEDVYKTLIEGQSLGKLIVYKRRKLILEDKPARTISWDMIRSKRDELLTNSDWTQISDSPVADEVRASWRTYRQALRDITEKFSDPMEVVWPETPTNKE